MKPINQPIHTHFNGITYDSRFESTIAEILQPYVYKGASIKQQVKIEIKPPTKMFKMRTWRCDFVIKYKESFKLIEAKGFADSSFKVTMELFEYFHPTLFDKLLIVVPNSFEVPRNWTPFYSKIIIKKELDIIIKQWVQELDKPP